jgi:hypothetical protein
MMKGQFVFWLFVVLLGFMFLVSILGLCKIQTHIVPPPPPPSINSPTIGEINYYE